MQWTWHEDVEAIDLPQLPPESDDYIAIAAFVYHVQQRPEDAERLSDAAGRGLRVYPSRQQECWYVFFVKRRDGGGFGGLLVARSAVGDIPEGAADLAAKRLSGEPRW